MGSCAKTTKLVLCEKLLDKVLLVRRKVVFFANYYTSAFLSVAFRAFRAMPLAPLL